MERSILHMDLDTFFVSCERLADRRLNDRPVLIGGTGSRGVVASCSYEARKFGVHSAMPMKMARRLCPEAIVIRGDSERYSRYSFMVNDIISEQVPVFEQSSIDEFYIDLSGMERFFGTYKLASQIREMIIKETGLPISFGLSRNKTVSKIATGEAKPNNQRHIYSGSEKQFLAPLSVQKIPMVGHQTYQQLCHLGIKKIKTLQEMPPELLQEVFGKNGKTIWQKAQGIDPSPVVPHREHQSVSSEHTFQQDTIDINHVRNLLISMTEDLAYQLRRWQKVTRCVTVKIRYSDFKTITRQHKVASTAAEHILIPVVLELFKSTYDRRILIRLIGVRFSNLVPGSDQLRLFDRSQEMARLYQAVDQMKCRYGQHTIKRAPGIFPSGKNQE